jgi:hypothetical protein
MEPQRQPLKRRGVSTPDGFDPPRPILCAFDDYDIAVLQVHPTDQTCRSILANQAIGDCFVVDPTDHRDDATCHALVSADGDSSLSVTGCAFTGLVATPSPEVSANLLREMQPNLKANRSTT